MSVVLLLWLRYSRPEKGPRAAHDSPLFMLTARPFFAASLCAWLALSALEAEAQTPDAAKTPPASQSPEPGARPLEEATGEPLTLERAVSLATERNETALAAQRRAEAADARVARARAFFFPELTVAGTYTRRLNQTVREVGGEQVVVQAFNALGATATARVQLFDARGFPLYRQARLEGQAAELDAREARRLVGFEAADAFLSTLGNQQVYEAAKRRLEFARQSLADAKARAEAGLASTNDVTRAELEVSTAEVQLASARGSADTSRIELGYLLVSPVEGALALPEPLLAEAAGTAGHPSGLAQEAQERRLDILSAKLKVEAQQANAREPLARLFPTLGLSGQYRLTNETGLAGRRGDGFLALDLDVEPLRWWRALRRPPGARGPGPGPGVGGHRQDSPRGRGFAARPGAAHQRPGCPAAERAGGLPGSKERRGDRDSL